MAQIHASADRGPIDASTPLHDLEIVLEPGAARRVALERLVSRQQNPQSPDYHRWLTPEQFAGRFGAQQGDAEKVCTWLATVGMTNIHLSRGRLFVTFSGTASAVEDAFQTPIHKFNAGGRSHFANVAPASIPAGLTGLVAGVIGLDDFNPEPQLAHAPASQYAGSDGASYLGPGDLAAIYDIHPLFDRGIAGSGVTVAVLGQTPVGLDDYRAYRAKFSLPVNDFQSIEALSSGGGTNAPTDLEEATLDLEAIGAVARNATIVYVWAANVEVAAAYAIDQQLAQVISLSYAGCETEGDEFYQMLALQAAVEGITWVSAAGDSGAAGCDAAGDNSAVNGFDVMVPASAPDVTAVGGTVLADGSSSEYWGSSNNALGGTALGYVPEAAWSGQGEVLAGGGGISNIFARPGYQSDFATSLTAGRMVPDVSLAAAPEPVPYLIVYNGSPLLVGGTSASTPVFAGIAALINNYLSVEDRIPEPGLGNINPVLYLLAEKAPDVFHDVTAGSNDVPCTVGTADCTTGAIGYAAQPGYDLATGLGSVDAYALASNWTNATFASSATTLSGSSSAVRAEEYVTLKALVTTGGNPLAGTLVEFYYTNPQSQYGQAMLGSAITDASGSATLMSNLMPIGVNTVTAVADGTTTVAASPESNGVAVSVSPFPTSIAIAPSGGPYRAGETITLAVQVSGPAGTVLAGPNFQDSHCNPGSVGLYSAAGALIVSGALSFDGSATLTTNTLAAGDNTFYVSYSGNDYAGASQSAVTFTATPQSAAGTTTTLSASSAQVTLGNSITLTARVAPAAGSAVPTGSVTFLGGASPLGTVVLDSTGMASYTFVPAPQGVVTLTAAYSGSSAFDGSASAPLDIAVAPAAGDFIILGPGSVTMTAGSSTVAVLSITPLNRFGGTIQLSCSGLPAGDSCSVPESVTPSGPATVTATLFAPNVKLASIVPVGLLILLFVGKRRTAWLVLPIIAVAGLMSGCGSSGTHSSNSAGFAAQAFAVTVTATSGSLSHQCVFNVTVAP